MTSYRFIVSDNQLDQYFQFVKDMLLEEVISEPLIHSAYYINQNFAYYSGFGQKNAAMHTMNLIIMYLCT